MGANEKKDLRIPFRPSVPSGCGMNFQAYERSPVSVASRQLPHKQIEIYPFASLSPWKPEFQKHANRRRVSFLHALRKLQLQFARGEE
jgi:hypothetical protein